MPDTTSDIFTLVDSLDPPALHSRRESILSRLDDGTGIRDYRKLSDEDLSELFAINRSLRRKQSGPPRKTPSEKASKAPKASGVADLF